MLSPQPAKLEHHWGIRDMIRARVTWGQRLPSNLEARPVLVVPVHQHPVIPARWQRACGTSSGWWAQGCQGHHATQSIPQHGGFPWGQGTPTFSPLAPGDPLAPCEDTNPQEDLNRRWQGHGSQPLPASTVPSIPPPPLYAPTHIFSWISWLSKPSWLPLAGKNEMCGIMNWGRS